MCINMHNNSIHNITRKTFNGLKSLEMLDISNNNNLSNIEEGSFDHQILTYLEIFGAKMSCTCEYIGMLKRLKLEWIQADCYPHYTNDTIHREVVQAPKLPVPDTHMWTS